MLPRKVLLIRQKPKSEFIIFKQQMERDKQITHKIMASIKSKNTEPELLLRKALWEQGFRYRINYKKLPGKPDIVFPKRKIAVFCDGDFWHGHNWAVRNYSSLKEELSTYSDFWKKKITNNVERDKRVNKKLKQDGWIVLRFWESDIRKNLNRCLTTISKAFYKQKISNHK